MPGYPSSRKQDTDADAATFDWIDRACEAISSVTFVAVEAAPVNSPTVRMSWSASSRFDA